MKESDFPPSPNAFVSLLSTGLDSPVATYFMMKKGRPCLSLSFLNGKEKSDQNRSKIREIGKKLVSLTNRPLRLHFLDYDYINQEIQAMINPKLICVVCKRTMMLTAMKLATQYQAQFIVNGDILSEQASQTMDNLYTVHSINPQVPVVRPLIGFDKNDVIQISKKLGLYDLSLIKGPACTFNPQFPETHATPQQLHEEERKINRSNIQQRIIDALTIEELKVE